MNESLLPLRKILFLLVAALFCAAVPSISAKAYYAPEDEMISRAEVIAIVDISRVEHVETKTSEERYSEIAHATVQETIKGTVPKTFKLHGGEAFICAQVHYAPGRYLVFLRHDEKLLIGCNWHLSVRPIMDTKVEWYVPGERLKLSWQPLDAVLARIKHPPTEPKAK